MTTDLAVRDTTRLGARSQCANHPGRQGNWRMPDGTRRCDHCHEEPIVAGWETADVRLDCPLCGELIRPGDRIAVLDTAPVARVCADCTEAGS